MFLSWFPENTYKRHRIISMKKKRAHKNNINNTFYIRMVVNLSRVFSRLFLTRHFLGFNMRCFTERYFSPVSSFSLLNISALHVQYGIQALAKFKRPECTRLHLRELQSQKFSRRSIRPKLPRKALRSQS